MANGARKLGRIHDLIVRIGKGDIVQGLVVAMCMHMSISGVAYIPWGAEKNVWSRGVGHMCRAKFPPYNGNIPAAEVFSGQLAGLVSRGGLPATFMLGSRIILADQDFHQGTAPVSTEAAVQSGIAAVGLSIHLGDADERLLHVHVVVSRRIGELTNPAEGSTQHMSTTTLGWMNKTYRDTKWAEDVSAAKGGSAKRKDPESTSPSSFRIERCVDRIN